jgi:hypothetical protein
MSKPKYQMEVCTDGECQNLGAKRDIEKAKAKIAREVARISKRVLVGKTPAGKVEGKVTDAEGKIVYEASRKYGEPGSKSHKRKAPPPPPPPTPAEPDDDDWDDEGVSCRRGGRR